MCAKAGFQQDLPSSLQNTFQGCLSLSVWGDRDNEVPTSINCILVLWALISHQGQHMCSDLVKSQKIREDAGAEWKSVNAWGESRQVTSPGCHKTIQQLWLKPEMVATCSRTAKTPAAGVIKEVSLHQVLAYHLFTHSLTNTYQESVLSDTLLDSKYYSEEYKINNIISGWVMLWKMKKKNRVRGISRMVYFYFR